MQSIHDVASGLSGSILRQIASLGAALARLFVSILSRVYNRIRLARRPSHRILIARSRRMLRKLRRIGVAPGALAYLRQVDPRLFEEIVLSALEQGGRPVKRSLRYTGDGGIDGHVYLAGWGWSPVQCKRYSNHVDHEHVRAFGQLLVLGRRKAGLFVHSGRSGAALYAHLRASQVLLVSGDALVALIVHGRLDTDRLRAGRRAWRDAARNE